MMSREILFKGKRKDNGEWVEGYYEELPAYDGTTTPKIVTPAKDTDDYNRWSFVLPDTVGQYTGLKDRNGTKIFEGDIVQGIAYSSQWRGVIIWIEKIASFGLQCVHNIAWENCSILKRAANGMNDEFTAEIIGNIYDNPELLEVK